jgi:HlyD family secretion protein
VQVRSQRPEGAESAAARAALAQAEANQQSAKVRLEQTVIRAPVDGVLISRSVEPGDIAQVGKTLMVLAPAGETQLVLQIDEKNLAFLAAGQKAQVSADAFPGQRFGAELIYINPGVDAQRGSVEVKLRAPQPPVYLKQDMTVSVDIEVARRDDALLAPADAVRDAAGKSPWVLALRGGRAEKVAVKLGLRGDAVAEIVEGVAPDELLIPASAVGVAAGDRVRRKG